MTDILPKQMTDDQLALRRKGIGASEVGRIMEGNWLSLYEEKLGIKQPDDLSTIFAVQLGMQTEPFNIFWCQAMFPQYFSESDINLNNGPIDRVSLASYQHPNLSYSFLSATPDAWCTIDGEHVPISRSQAHAAGNTQLHGRFQPICFHDGVPEA